jgi:hypothetical protein
MYVHPLRSPHLLDIYPPGSHFLSSLVIKLRTMEWLEQMDAPVEHLPSAVIIPKAEYLSLLLSAFHGIKEGTHTILSDMKWSWQPIPTTATSVQLNLSLTVGPLKGLKYPFDLSKVAHSERANRMRQFVFMPLNAAWSSLNPSAASKFRLDLDSSLDDPAFLPPVTKDSHQLWMDVMSPTVEEPPASPKKEQTDTSRDKSFAIPSPAKPEPSPPRPEKKGSVSTPIAASSTPLSTSTSISSAATSSSAGGSVPHAAHAFSLHYDASGAGEDADSLEFEERKGGHKRKEPDSDVKQNKKNKQRKYGFL